MIINYGSTSGAMIEDIGFPVSYILCTMTYIMYLGTQFVTASLMIVF